MSEVQSEKSKSDGLKYAIWAVIAVGVAVALYVMAQAMFKPSGPADLISFRKGELSKLEVPGHPKARNPRFPDIDQGESPAAMAAPALTFEGPDGKPTTFAAFKGKVTVVNLWATWCAPCKIEMPTLGHLAAAYPTQPLAVVAISTDEPDSSRYPGDTMDAAIVRAKEELAKSPPLQFYHSPGLGMTFQFNPPVGGLPTTIIYDKRGVERARLSGGADWNGADARALIETLLKERA
jgi:thiol-disulfide isomerase/thioredoxin